jgi:hypothetical protein
MRTWPGRARFDDIENSVCPPAKESPDSSPTGSEGNRGGTLIMPEEGAVSADKTANPASAPQLNQIALSFLRLGTIAFGGPAAHVAMMEEEFVRRRGWLSHADFLDGVAAASV